MKIDPYILLQTEISQYCNLNNDSWEKIRFIFKPDLIAKNEIFVTEGENSFKFGFVYSGCFRSFNLVESGKELTKDFFRSKDFIVGAINHYDKNMVSIQALTKCEILVTEYKSIEERASNDPIISDFKNNLVSHYVRLKQRRENYYLTLESNYRYELFLNEYPNLMNEIPHHYIASYLGISATQLSRIRRKMLKD